MLKIATNVDEIADSFSAMALSTEQEMKDYYVETMDARTGNPDKSPIDILEKACRKPSERGAMLLLGHRGCGKSTELNDMRLRLEAEKRPITIIQCEERLPLENNPRFSDLLILMGEALYQLAWNNGAEIASETLVRINNFWTPVLRTATNVKAEEISVEAAAKMGTPALLKAVGELFVQLTSSVKYSDTVREESEKYVRKNYQDWRSMIRSLADAIFTKVKKQPVLIFEGLDHLEDLDEARKLFFEHADKLTDVSFPVIYTFPISLYYDVRFKPFEDQFRYSLVFPMLKLENVDGTPFPEGKARLKEIAERRMITGLIQPDALDLMIEKTGGSLRDLFQAIREAAETASYRSYRTGNPNETVTLRDAENALMEVQSNLSRRIEGDEHRFLAEICLGKRRKIQDREMLLNMLQARTVLEYNGKRWFNVHPLIADYLEELGYIRRKEDNSGWEAGEEMQGPTSM